MRNVTIVGNGREPTNTRTGNAQLVNDGSTPIQVSNTLIATSRSGVNCIGVIASGDYNLDDGHSCTLAGVGDQSAVNPMVAPLADNGGLLPTVALLRSSPAIDAANNCPAIDERGFARPIDGNGDGVATCDIGAFEYRADPQILQANPQTVQAGGAAFTLSLSGDNFAANAQASWQGANRPTQFVSVNQLNVQISASDIAAGTVAALRVAQPDGRISSTFAYTVTNPIPMLTSINPPLIAQGLVTTTVSVLGSNFVPTSQVNVNRIALPTTFISTTLLRAQVPVLLTQQSQNTSVYVENGAPGGGKSSTGRLAIGLTNVAGVGGGVPTVAISGTVAYLGEGRQISLVNIQDETQPTLISQFSAADRINDIEVVGQRLYATFAGGFLILDISNSARPRKLGEYLTGTTAYDIKIVNNRAYLTDNSDYGFKIFDIVNAIQPRFLGSYKTTAYDLDVVGNLAYVATGNNPLMAFNVADPANITLVDSYVNYRTQSLGVQVVGNRVYVAEGRDGFHVIELAKRADYWTPNGALERTKDVYVEGNRAYVTSFNGLLSILDVTDITQVKLLASYKTGGSSWDVRAKGNRAYLADGSGGLKILNVENGAVPTLIGQYSVWSPRKLAVADSAAYTASGKAGLQVVDVFAPIALSKRSSITTTWEATNVAAAGPLALVVERGVFDTNLHTEVGGGLQIFDTSAQPPQLQATLPITYAYAVAVQGSTAFVGSDLGVEVYDIQNPQAPRQQATLPVPFTRVLAVRGNFVYAVSQTLTIIDIQNIAAPVIRGQISSGNGLAIRLVGNRAYIISSNLGGGI